MKIYIGLHKSSGFLSSLIKWQTRSQYSHASLLFENGDIIEADNQQGVRLISSYKLNNKETIDVFFIEVSNEQYNVILDFAKRQLGKEYDWTMAVRFVTREQETRKSAGKWFCSELVFAALTKAKIKVLIGVEPWEVSPGMLSRSPLLQYNYSIVTTQTILFDSTL